jgi:formylglycine-generating enzyme required for sulfatase activity
MIFRNAINWQFVLRNMISMSFKIPPGKESHPVTKASCKEAQLYIGWLNETAQGELPAGTTFRLPSEAEWEKAARGTDGRLYPWGNEFDKHKCNTQEGGEKGSTRVGRFSPDGDSPYGVADMAGNVWELTRSIWGATIWKPDFNYPYVSDDGRETDQDISRLRITRGGTFKSDRKDARCAWRGFATAHNNDFGCGFRVVVSPIGS